MANLSQLQRARQTAKKHGWKVRSIGQGDAHHLHFQSPKGQKLKVWYPWDGRVFDREEKDLDEVISHMEGSK